MGSLLKNEWNLKIIAKKTIRDRIGNKENILGFKRKNEYTAGRENSENTYCIKRMDKEELTKIASDNVCTTLDVQVRTDIMKRSGEYACTSSKIIRRRKIISQ